MDFLQKHEKRTGKTPPALLSRPTPTKQAQYYLNIFYTLCQSRIVGFSGIGFIPISEINAFVQLAGINDFEERLELLNYVQFCDNVYLTQIQKKGPKHDARKQSKARGRQLSNGRRR